MHRRIRQSRQRCARSLQNKVQVRAFHSRFALDEPFCFLGDETDTAPIGIKCDDNDEQYTDNKVLPVTCDLKGDQGSIQHADDSRTDNGTRDGCNASEQARSTNDSGHDGSHLPTQAQVWFGGSQAR